jgi:hypothetical protein
MGAEPVRGTGQTTDGDSAADEARQAQEAQARAAAKAEQQARKAEEKARKAEEKKRQAEARAAEQARREEEKRRAEEQRQAEEAAAEAARVQAAKESAERAAAAVTAPSGFDTAAVLREVAKPRLTGSRGARETAETLRACFAALGYDVQDREFTFNPWPGRLGITVAGAIYLIGSLAAAGLLYADNPFAAVAMLLIVLVVVGLIGLFARPAIDALPLGSQPGMNMLMQKPGSRPRYIIMAHRDSKSQPVPLAFRGPAIGIGVVTWLALLVAALLHTARPLPGGVILLLGALAAVAGLVLVFCWVDNRSPGALDNASGVVAALGIAAREADAGDVAFLITDAEELGLAGARAAAPHLPPVFGVINLDGLDDEGNFYVLERFGTLRKQGLAPHLAAALLQEADARGEPADRRDLPFGIPVDHIPIVRAGTPALTLMRGSLKSLRRVHQPADNLDSLSGDGVNRAIELVCGALARLRAQSQTLQR